MPLMKPAGIPILNRQHPLSKGLVAAYIMNEGPHNGKTFDYSGYGNHGVLTNMNPDSDWVGGKDGFAIDFAGADGEHINSGSDSTLQILGDVTLECRFKADSLASDPRMIVFGADGEAEAANVLYALVITTDGRLLLQHEYGEGNNQFFATASSYISSGWYHIVVTRNSTDKEWKVYVNGVYRETLAFSENTTGGTAGTLWLCSWLGVDNLFDGKIDLVRIFSRTLSGSEVPSLFRDPYAMFRPMISLPAFLPVAAAAGNPWYFYSQQ